MFREHLVIRHFLNYTQLVGHGLKSFPLLAIQLFVDRNLISSYISRRQLLYETIIRRVALETYLFLTAIVSYMSVQVSKWVLL